MARHNSSPTKNMSMSELLIIWSCMIYIGNKLSQETSRPLKQPDMAQIPQFTCFSYIPHFLHTTARKTTSITHYNSHYSHFDHPIHKSKTRLISQRTQSAAAVIILIPPGKCAAYFYITLHSLFLLYVLSSLFSGL